MSGYLFINSTTSFNSLVVKLSNTNDFILYLLVIQIQSVLIIVPHAFMHSI